MKRKIFVVATLTALLLAGCGSGGGSKASVQEAEPIPGRNPSSSPSDRKSLPISAALLVMRALCCSGKKGKNAVVSPWAMLWLSAYWKEWPRRNEGRSSG